MPPLDTREQTQQYLEQLFPTRQEWWIHPFPEGWICQPKLTQDQIDSGQGLGLTNLVIDSSTGVVIEYPSWSTKMVAEDYIRTKHSGLPPTGRQIHPPRTTVTVQLAQENSDTIQYLVRTETLTQPPTPATETSLTIDKNTLAYQPTGSMMARVVSWTDWRRSQDGTWPTQGTFQE